MSCLSRCIVFWALYIGKNYIYYKNIIFKCNFNVNVSKWCIDIGIFFQNLIQSLWVDLTKHLNVCIWKFLNKFERLRIISLNCSKLNSLNKFIFFKKIKTSLIYNDNPSPCVCSNVWIFWDNQYLSTRLIVFYFMNSL